MGNKIKWMFSFCIAALIVFGGASGVNAWTNDDGIKYEINDNGTVSVTGYDGESDTVTIPSEIDGKRVKEVIAERGYISGFPGTIKHITIANGIELSYYAFFDCTRLNPSPSQKG